MEYFDLFQIPVSLKVDSSIITRKYYNLCREYHPDHFTLSDAASQNESLDMISKINEAKLVLLNSERRLEYILSQKGIIQNDEKYNLSPQFLGMMMDINEQVMEYKMNHEFIQLSSIHSEIQKIEVDLKKTVQHFFEMEVFQMNDEDEAILKDYYYKRKYIQRLESQIK